MTSSAATTRKVFEFTRFGAPFTLLADSVAAFTEESALIPTSLSPNKISHNRAWMLTLTVVGADALLLTHYWRKTRKSPRKSPRRRHSQASAMPPLEGEEIAPA